MNRSGLIPSAASATLKKPTFSSTKARVRPALVDGALGDVDRVLVGPGQEPRVVAEHPVPARDDVGADDLVERVQARLVVRVGDRGREVDSGGDRVGRAARSWDGDGSSGERSARGRQAGGARPSRTIGRPRLDRLVRRRGAPAADHDLAETGMSVVPTPREPDALISEATIPAPADPPADAAVADGRRRAARSSWARRDLPDRLLAPGRSPRRRRRWTASRMRAAC